MNDVDGYPVRVCVPQAPCAGTVGLNGRQRSRRPYSSCPGGPYIRGQGCPDRSVLLPRDHSPEWTSASHCRLSACPYIPPRLEQRSCLPLCQRSIHLSIEPPEYTPAQDGCKCLCPDNVLSVPTTLSPAAESGLDTVVLACYTNARCRPRTKEIHYAKRLQSLRQR